MYKVLVIIVVFAILFSGCATIRVGSERLQKDLETFQGKPEISLISMPSLKDPYLTFKVEEVVIERVYYEDKIRYKQSLTHSGRVGCCIFGSIPLIYGSFLLDKAIGYDFEHASPDDISFAGLASMAALISNLVIFYEDTAKYYPTVRTWETTDLSGYLDEWEYKPLIDEMVVLTTESRRFSKEIMTDKAGKIRVAFKELLLEEANEVTLIASLKSNPEFCDTFTIDVYSTQKQIKENEKAIALLMKADGYYDSGQYYKALNCYNKILEEYSETEVIPKVREKIDKRKETINQIEERKRKKLLFDKLESSSLSDFLSRWKDPYFSPYEIYLVKLYLNEAPIGIRIIIDQQISGLPTSYGSLSYHGKFYAVLKLLDATVGHVQWARIAFLNENMYIPISISEKLARFSYNDLE